VTILRVGDYILRPPVHDDLDALHALTQSPEMHRFLGGNPPSMADSFARLQRTAGGWTLYGYGAFMVIDTRTDMLIGNAAIFFTHRGLGDDFDNQPEAGWIIAQSHWGQGLAVKLMTAVLDWFDATHGPQRIVAMIEEGHVASGRIADQLGFVHYRTGNLDGKATLQLYERLPPTASA
jgi:RimJ/RimL family protein N-acetyltransferase